jgi:hypothetical protein
MGAFDNIVTAEMKTLYTDGIDALLQDDAMTVPCTLIMQDTSRTDCPNCVRDNVTGKSSNKYTPGGPRPFYTGICPYCHGAGIITSDDEEEIYLIALWDYKDWVNWKGSDERSRYPENYVQTMSKISTITKIKRAKELIVNTDLEEYAQNRFTRDGSPQPCGWGQDSYIFTMWKRIQ